jgi:hypothetical protein
MTWKGHCNRMDLSHHSGLLVQSKSIDMQWDLFLEGFLEESLMPWSLLVVMLYIFWSYLNLIWRLDSSLIAIGVEPGYRSIARSLSRRGPKGEPDASTAAESEIANLVRRLKLIRRSDSSMIAIGVDAEYRSVSRSLFGWGPKGESNAPIIAGAKSWISWGGDALVVILSICYETLEF